MSFVVSFYFEIFIFRLTFLGDLGLDIYPNFIAIIVLVFALLFFSLCNGSKPLKGVLIAQRSSFNILGYLRSKKLLLNL